jgi:hypothetical protein
MLCSDVQCGKYKKGTSAAVADCQWRQLCAAAAAACSQAAVRGDSFNSKALAAAAVAITRLIAAVVGATAALQACAC